MMEPTEPLMMDQPALCPNMRKILTLLFLLPAIVAQTVATEIKDLPAASSVNSTDLLEIQQPSTGGTGSSKKASRSLILNGLVITTTSAGTLTLGNSSALVTAASKTVTFSNTLTFTGTDSSSVAFGGGGTVAYTSNNLSVFAATTSAQLLGVLSDETGTGLAVFGTSPTISTPNIVGTTAVGNASAGSVGEVVSSLVATGSAVSLTTVTTANVTSISLTAGDWDVEGNVNWNFTSTTTTASSAGISTTSATLPTDGSEVANGSRLTTTTDIAGSTLPRKRVNVSGTTTVYLVTQVAFTAGTTAAWGSITARRVR